MRRQPPSRRGLRHFSQCFSASSSSSTSSAEFETLPFLGGPIQNHHSRGDDGHEAAGDGGASPGAAEWPAHGGRGDAPSGLSGCMALLRNRCWLRGQGGGDGLEAALERYRTADRTEKLQAEWALEDQLASRLQRPSPPLTHLHVSSMPMQAAAATWLGGWRPSAILSLVPVLCRAALSRCRRRFLEEAIRRFQVEEAVLDEEMTELCCMGILSLLEGDCGAVVKGLRRAAERARQLRCGAMEIAVRRLLEPAEAAEFLIRFEGFQRALLRMEAEWSAGVGDLRVSLQQSSVRHGC